MRDLQEASHPPTGDYRFATTAFDPVDTGSRRFGDWTMAAPGVAFSADTPPSAIARTPVDPLRPADTWQISVASVLQLALFGLGGYGWARVAAFEPGLDAAAVAPAFGFGALILLAVALERLGVPLTGSIGPLVVSAIAAGGGFALLALLALLEGRGGSRPPDQVDEEPPE
jgi:hypothetical protein